MESNQRPHQYSPKTCDDCSGIGWPKDSQSRAGLVMCTFGAGWQAMGYHQPAIALADHIRVITRDELEIKIS
jgi:hypothetical protein